MAPECKQLIFKNYKSTSTKNLNMRTILITMLTLFSAVTFAQNISFTFVNARNTNDGTNDFYEADIYIASDTDFILGSGQIYFNYNTAAFGDNVHTNGNFTMETPRGFLEAYNSFIVNDNNTSRVSTSFQQNASINAFTISGVSSNVTSTPSHLYSIKIKYSDINESPNVTFETGGVFLDQFFTACGPTSGSNSPDCTNHPGTQITGDTFDSTGAVIITGATWTGTVDPDWSTAGNWDINALPETTYDITIPNLATSPVIGIGTAAQMDDLTIEPSASLVLLDAASAEIEGNFVNDGAISLNSSATNSSSLIFSGTASGSGTVTYHRGGLEANQWHVISAPVVGQSIKEFAENVSNDIRVNNSVNPNRYAIAYYDDSNADGAKWVYYTANDLTTNTLTFEKGRGYAISRATDGGVSFTGTLENSTVNKTVVASEWNAVGNPFTAFLPLNENTGDNFLADNAINLDPAYVAAYVWDNAQNKYAATSQATSENALAPGQGFFIKANATANTITLDKSQLITQASTAGVFNRTTENVTPELNIVATSNGTSVKTAIKYFPNATKGLDPGYDVGNFSGASFDIYTHLLEGSSEDFTIQSLPNSNYDSMVIPVGVKLAANEKMTFTATSVNLNDSEIYLEDKENNTFTKISDNESYSVTVKSTIDGVGRFFIHTQAKSLSNDTFLTSDVKIYTNNSKIILDGLNNGNYTFELYDLLGKRVYQETIKNSNKTTIDTTVSTGIFIVKMDNKEGKSISKKIVLK